MTHREARAKLGSRRQRRSNTNGKNIPGRPQGKGGRIAFKFRNPKPASRKVAVGVKRLRRAAQEEEGDLVLS